MKILKLVMMVTIIAFASIASAASVTVDKDANVSVGIKADGSVDIKTKATPNITPAKAGVKQATAKKKKTLIKKKSPVKPAAVPTQVAAAPMISSTASVSTAVSPTAQAVSATAVAVTKTANADNKKKSKFNFNLFKIFMPDAVTTTALSDHLVLIAGMRVMNGTNTADQPNGFKTVASDSTGTNSDFAVAAKIWRVGAEYDLTPDETDLPTSWNGSKLNGVHLTTSNKIIGKLYAVDNRNYGLTLGLGAEYTSISGAVSMGGFRFQTEGEGWTPVVQFGGEYHLNKWWTLGIVYERSNIRVTTKIPGAPDLITTRNDRMLFRLSLGLF